MVTDKENWLLFQKMKIVDHVTGKGKVEYVGTMGKVGRVKRREVLKADHAG